MDFATYQRLATLTDQRPGFRLEDIAIPLFGLAGEAGSLLSAFKKHLRDGTSYVGFKDHVGEELGDLLWYLTNVATKTGLQLEQIAAANLAKTRDWFGEKSEPYVLFDSTYPKTQRFPLKFTILVKEQRIGKKAKVRLSLDGKKVGDELTDNAYQDDGYRFHDVFHLAYVAVLGWSPVIRKLLGRKRRSKSSVDEVEDGGRAGVIDEAIAAIVFDYARNHRYFAGVKTIDYELLAKIKTLTSHLEVSQRSVRDWQKAILAGFAVWRDIRDNNGGAVVLNLEEQTISFSEPTKAHRAAVSKKARG
jgi:NTP pyrophosphatase (non-canonical NTP hydrolase)